ncbi:terpene synthase family protein [Nocardia pseudovaccinii]|uniref:terpene synthase family protein n=1 Tax=Nocardia pseudovaccinii TaxID=189540 RepID=UPI0007A44723|nr:hypothetical protein [Nocardia pseudovaccinii]
MTDSTDQLPNPAHLDAADAIELGLRSRRHTDDDATASRIRVQQWVLERGLVVSPEAFAWFAAWGIHDFVASSYPDATPGEGMDLVGRFMAVAILLDDQLDELGSPADCARQVRPFLDIVDGGGERIPAAATLPLHTAFAEMIRDCRARASVAWWQRAAQAWQASLLAIVHEITDRELRGGPAPRDIHLTIRHASGFMVPFLDVLEPAAGPEFELIDLAYYSPHLRLMRDLVVDLGNFVNDVYSLPKELARGQTSNMVMVVRAETGQSVPVARRDVLDLIAARVRRFRQLHSELPQVCTALELSAPDRERTLRYGAALEYWLGGYEPWHRRSARYLNALAQRPAPGPWAYEDLLTGPVPEQISEGPR